MPRQITLLPSEGADLVERVEAPPKITPEDLFAAQLRPLQNLGMVRQHLFAKQALGRKWAFDFAFMPYKLAVEIDGVCVRRLAGQLVVMGRHASIDGIRGDNEKLNAAALLGWTVLRFLQSDVKPRLAYKTTLAVLAAKGWRSTP